MKTGGRRAVDSHRSVAQTARPRRGKKKVRVASERASGYNTHFVIVRSDVTGPDPPHSPLPLAVSERLRVREQDGGGETEKECGEDEESVPAAAAPWLPTQ